MRIVGFEVNWCIGVIEIVEREWMEDAEVLKLSRCEWVTENGNE